MSELYYMTQCIVVSVFCYRATEMDTIVKELQSKWYLKRSRLSWNVGILSGFLEVFLVNDILDR